MPSAAVIAGIRKDIEAYEAVRAAACAQVRWRVPVFISVVVVAVVVIAWLFNGVADPNEQWLSTPHVFLYIGGFFALVGAYFLAMRPANRVRQSFRDRLLPIIFGFIEEARYQHGVKPNSFDRLPREAIGSFDRAKFDDIVSGRYADFPFELYEARLSAGYGKNEKVAFKGVIVAFEAVTPFPGTLVATRHAGAVTSFFRGFFASRLEEMSSDDPFLNETYEFRTDNVEAARPLVSGRLAKALKWLNESWPSGPARVALSGSDGFLMLPQGKNFFELPPISTPLDYKNHIEPMIADLASILATVELVRKVGEKDERAGSAIIR